ncbi:MAG TPA: DUF1707 domain-containing protein [Thermoleophilaceae bacterium]|jgi:hypothetical protein
MSRHTSSSTRIARRPAPHLRASDADRDRAVDMLRDHAAAGRLSTEELEDRTDSALAATTFGQLDAVLSDLPRQRDPRRAERRHDLARKAFATHLRTYVMVMVLLVAIWALTGMGYFWPVWPALGWGIGIASHGAYTPRGRRGHGQPRAMARP